MLDRTFFFQPVFSTKNRGYLIGSPEQGQVIAGLFKAKAHNLDV